MRAKDQLTEEIKSVQKSDQKSIVVGIVLKNEERPNLEEDLDELEALLKTLGIATFGRIVQRREKLVARSLLGSGKVEEIKDLAEQVGAGLIVFDHELSPTQLRNVEEVTKCRVTDRTGIILDIFAKHARTNYAKTQVEIARLEYLLPRLTGAWTHFQRQTGGGGGGVYARGMGEKQIEVDRRRAREKIVRLQRQLEQFDKEKKMQREGRKNELKVAIVGYTNGGKTTLMNALTKAELLAKDELFATLDTNVKVIDPKTRPKILLSDTVGFIRNLPTGLVESFKSTLGEVLEADLILHVVDISHPRYEEHIKVTEQVLEEIGGGNIPTLMVFNKIDLIQDEPFLPKVLKAAYKKSIVASAFSREDAARVREHIYQFFEANMLRVKLKVKHSDAQAISHIYNTCLILGSDYAASPEEIIFEVQTTKPLLAKLTSYIVEVSNDAENQENKFKFERGD